MHADHNNTASTSVEEPCGETVGQAACRVSCLTPDTQLPLVVSPTDKHSLAEYRDAIKQMVSTHLSTVGGLLFRGFPIESATDFETLVKMLSPALASYEFGSTPRSQVHNQIYTSTEYPPHQHIPLHNEQAYTTEWPMKIWFYCAQVSPEGGYTPIADSREVYRHIPIRIRERFLAEGVMYVRNYGNGLDVPWNKVFNTMDRRVVEQYCRSTGIEYEWKADGELRTRQVCQAVSVHPRTRETVWFNQAHLFHVSNLEPAVREALLSFVNEEDLPRQAFYGDGTPIESTVLDEIRDVYQCHAVQFPWQRGDVLMLDNMLVAHGRTPFRGPREILVAMAESSKS
ncbi:MAG: TauD/TfdA family dioxygenase [Nitrospira sp.]|nr:TauD/TfdA family dioxygenase [Nitrospira sp.]